MLLLAALQGAGPLERGSAHLREGKFDAAIQELTRAVAAAPRSAVAHLLLGQAYLAKGAAEFVAEAKGEFQQARELDPKQPLTYYYIAKIDLELGRLERAETEVRRGLEVAPRASFLTSLLGEIRRRQGKPEEAVKLAEDALAAEPGAIPILYSRALAYLDAGQFAKARSDLERAIASPFVTAEMFEALGKVHAAEGKWKDAETALRRAIQASARAETHLLLARSLRHQRRFDEALAELKRAEQAPQLSSEYFERLASDVVKERDAIRRER